MTPSATPQTDDSSLAATIGRLAGVVGHAHYPAGDRAALKRWAPGQPVPLAFYRLWLRHLGDELPVESQTPAWMTLAWGVAALGAASHRPDRPLGRALAESGYAEARLERLLAAPEELRIELFMSTARFLAARNESFDWLDAALFLLTTDPQAHERACRRIAQAFFRHLPRDLAKE
ncbi:type I-E CRISPR-associated protein Cse2/CasB [Caldimonas thermodepolymerans]|jgi:CRISPR type I-E/ECOLI-associated protein CasB/Cse2|uniref:type I-E CRISPR-associated protein Cse2/CasB n=1 Tax=Caldimonas thermodepolymerans TaxID=215580 RepID=UPI0024929092|nr:type I-E CRISPR-associated protein Cse2/CasB [Caldimonas thermodepolymerans]